MTTEMIMNTSPPGADTCAACAERDGFCVDHLHAFVGLHATTVDQHQRHLRAVEQWPRIEALDRQKRADAELDRNLRRILANKPRDMARLLLLAVEVHDSRTDAIMADLSRALDPRS